MRYLPTSAIVVVTGVGTAVQAELAVQGQPPVERYCPVVPGDIAWDACDCGQLAQTITSTYPSNSFPTNASDQRRTPCGPNLTVATVNLSLTRCVPSPDSNGRPPTCAQLLAAAVTLEVDRWVVRKAVACYLRTLRETQPPIIADFSVGTVISVGPQGGCVGVQLAYSFALGSLCCG